MEALEDIEIRICSTQQGKRGGKRSFRMLLVKINLSQNFSFSLIEWTCFRARDLTLTQNRKRQIPDTWSACFSLISLALARKADS